MASGILYTYPGSFRANKILITAEYSGVNITVDPNFEYGKTNTSDEFLRKFPLGKVPAFEASDRCLNESNAIALYLSNEALAGGNNSSNRAAVTEYISFSDNEILPSACTWVYPTLGFKQYNKQDTEKAQDHIKKCLTKLNNDLKTKTFLVGERITLADITLCTSLVMLYVQVMDPKFREPFQNVNRWFVTCINQSNFKKILGEVKLCEKMAAFDNKRYQELHQKGGKDKSKKVENPKDKKGTKPATDSAANATAGSAPASKKIDYFANVPASDFVMDNWKKECSNNEDTCLQWLKENFDKNAFSIWYTNYRLDDEVKKDLVRSFMVLNLMKGLTQRIESLRKHAYGLLYSFEEEEPGQPTPKYFSISGLWLFRGQDVAFKLNPDWNVDAEFYDFKKLDIDNAADFKIISDFFEGKNPGGKEFQDMVEFK